MALFECDFCSAKTAEGLRIDHHGPFLLQTPIGVLDVAPGAFAACPTCAAFWESGDTRGLAAAAAAVHQGGEATLQSFEMLYSAVRLHQLGTQRINAADKKLAPADFFDSVCPRCGHITQIESATYDRVKRYRCAGCGLYVNIVSKAAPA